MAALIIVNPSQLDSVFTIIRILRILLDITSFIEFFYLILIIKLLLISTFDTKINM